MKFKKSLLLIGGTIIGGIIFSQGLILLAITAWAELIDDYKLSNLRFEYPPIDLPINGIWIYLVFIVIMLLGVSIVVLSITLGNLKSSNSNNPAVGK